MLKEELRELYRKDFPLWAQINYELLKDRLCELVDWEEPLGGDRGYVAIPNIIEETQELGAELREEDLPQECPYTHEEAMNRDLRKEVNP